MTWRSLAFLALIAATNAQGQTVSTGVSRDSIRVGDPVRVLIRVDGLAANAEVILPDSLPTSEDIENAGRVRTRRDTVPGGYAQVTAAYPLIAWRPGENPLPSIPMIVRTPAGESTRQITLPALNVISVLPPDTSNIEAKPVKDVWGPDRVWWPWLLAAALLLMVAALLYWWYRKRRAARIELPVIPFIDPRERALQELQGIRDLQLIEQAEFKRHYILLSEVLRTFAASLESDWSTDLTTEELVPRLKRSPQAKPLTAILRSADTVKFARRVPTAAEARSDLDAAEAWVRSYERRAATAEAA